MFGLGIGELSVILVIIVFIFGARKLPEIGEGLGKGILNFRQSLKALNESPTARPLTHQDDDKLPPCQGSE